MISRRNMLGAVLILGMTMLISLAVNTPAQAAQCSYQVTAVTPGANGREWARSWCMTSTRCCLVTSFQQMARTYFNNYRNNFLMNSFYQCPTVTSLQSQANEMRSAKTFRTAIMGAFMDASVLNDTLLALSAHEAETLKSYTPSDQMCKFGSLTKALAASESKMDLDRTLLGDAGVARNLGRINTAASAGRGAEYMNRLKTFVEKYCSLKDNNDGMKGTCMSATPVQDIRHNRDIDYARLMANGTTINADFTNTSLTMDETSVLQVANSLYGHRLPVKRFTNSDLRERQSAELLNREYRSAFARRAAAQNTYNTLAAMKMAGSGGSDTYIRQVLAYIGMSTNDIDHFIAARDPDYGLVSSSYNAQMNLLSKQLYQEPAFYANLMDSKANVKRTSAALQGIGLMQQRDTYKSMARSEMLAAILVELEAIKIANNVQGEKSK